MTDDPLDEGVGVRVLEGNALGAGEPEGVEPEEMWSRFITRARLVSPSNRHTMRIVVVGTGLAGAGAAASLAELGFDVVAVTGHDTPRRAHSVAAQGGVNAARARRVDGDSLARFVSDTVKGGDFRARESEAWRLGEESTRVIDHLNALGVPFAREYGGSLSTRSFGGVQVSRTYYSRGQTGQQLQVAASSALMRQVALGRVELWVRHEVLDVLVVEGRAAGVITRDLRTGALHALTAHAVVLATGGYGNVFFHSTLAKNSNATAIWRAHRAGAAFASPSFVQFHPTALPILAPWQSKTTLMSESLRNDGRIWVPVEPGDPRPPSQIPDDQRDYYLERTYPAYGNLTPRDIASRAARDMIETGHGVGPLHNAVYLDFREAVERLGRATIEERYGNLFAMYRDSTGEDPLTDPMRIAPGAHFTMGGLWVDYHLMSTLPGLFVAGEANGAYHGANRLGANSLLAACVDGFFTIPRTVPDHLAPLLGRPRVREDDPAVRRALDRVSARIRRVLDVGGSTPARTFHRLLGETMYRTCGVVRDREGLEEGIREVAALRRGFWADVAVSGAGETYNQDLVEALRVADHLELAELMCVDALHREESCGAHFRIEHQDRGEAVRDDAHWHLVSAWTTTGWEGPGPVLATHHAEHLRAGSVPVTERSYR